MPGGNDNSGLEGAAGGSNSKKVRRRTFINTVGLAAGSAVLVDPLLEPRAHAASKVVYSAHSAQLVSGSSPGGVQEQWVQAARGS